MSEALKVPMDDLETSDYDLFLDVTYEGEPYTGIGYEDNRHYYSEYRYANGKGHGKCFSVYKNGQQMEEFELCEGTHINEGHSWYRSGQRREYVRHTPIRLVRRWCDSGVLLYEEDEEAHVIREWYPTGELSSVYTKPVERINYAKDGNWIVKHQSRDGYLVFDADDMIFHEELLEEKCEQLLQEASLENVLFLWLTKKLQVNPDKGVRILCELIEHRKLYVKDRAIFIAGKQKIEEARPYLEAALADYRIPPAESDPIRGGGRAHSRRICDQATIALDKLNQG